jgi:hypothetical protein
VKSTNYETPYSILTFWIQISHSYDSGTLYLKAFADLETGSVARRGHVRNSVHTKEKTRTFEWKAVRRRKGDQKRNLRKKKSQAIVILEQWPVLLLMSVELRDVSRMTLLVQWDLNCHSGVNVFTFRMNKYTPREIWPLHFTCSITYFIVKSGKDYGPSGISLLEISECVYVLFKFLAFALVCMHVCTRMGQRLALAPRPLMIYCASPFD